MKVFVVDDEAIVRVGLKSLINWEEHGYVLVGEASDGNKALEAIRTRKPDIVITDIKMPVMDGIELIRTLTKMENPPKIVVLSSYSDFPLVKEAMRLGASDYLLKLEITPELLLNVLDELRAEHVKHSHPNEQLYQTSIRKNIHVLKQKFFKDLLNFHMDEEELRQSVALYEINLSLNMVVCVAIRITQTYGRTVAEDKDMELLSFSVVNIVEEILNVLFSGHCFVTKPFEFSAVISASNEEHLGSFTELLSTVVEMLKTYLNVDAVIGSGRWHQGIEGLKQSYREARQALDIGVATSQKPIVFWEDIASSRAVSSMYTIMPYKDLLTECLQFCQTENLEQLFAKIRDEIRKRSLPLENQIDICLELHFMLSDFFTKHELEINEVLGEAYRTPQQIAKFASLRQVLDWLAQVRDQLKAFTSLLIHNGGSRAVVKAKKFIAENYMKNVTLKDVAKEVHLTPFYLSHLFVQHAGKSFTEYLTHVRIRKSQELLRQTDLKIYEIGELVGYQNSTYFNKIFKKVTGMTPIEFRNKCVDPADWELFH